MDKQESESASKRWREQGTRLCVAVAFVTLPSVVCFALNRGELVQALQQFYLALSLPIDSNAASH